MPFEFKKLQIPEVVLIEPKIFADNRGFYLECYKSSDFEKVGIKMDVVQQSYSKSKKGVLRGLHFQKGKHAQAKLVRCIKGKIFDVAVDLRKDSPTYKKWVGIELSEENKHILYIPRGFAHGFYTLSKEAEVEYLVDNEYAPESEGGIIWNDPTINIKWPFKGEPILSEKDKKWPSLSEY